MDSSRRQRLVTELSGLNSHEFDSLIDAVNAARGTTEAGAAVLQEAFDRSRQPLAARLFAGNDDDEE